jgi:hypothetical protein
LETFFLFLAFSPRLPTFINFRTKGFQSHHKADCVLHAYAHVAVEFSVLAISYKTSLTPPLFTEVPVPSQESELSCICVLKVSFLSLTTIFSIGFLELFRQRVWNCSDSVFGAVPTACLELFRQCGICLFCIYFYFYPMVK